jgi:hypothetical protein
MTAREALARGRSSSAGLAAIHAVISACDGFTAFQLGLRSTGQDHLELLALLARTGMNDAEPRLRQVRGVLQLKHTVEYEDRELSRPEAQRLVMWAERIFAWTREAVPP